MRTLNLEQVKEHFKYAKEVRCLDDGEIFNLCNISSQGIYSDETCFAFVDNDKGADCVLYDIATNQLAEILTYVFDRGEEVEVSDDGKEWEIRRFIGFDLNNNAIVEGRLRPTMSVKHIRKLTPESLLEPQLSEFKKFAESKLNCTVTIIFENK